MGAANGRPLTDPEGPTAASTTQDSGIGLGGTSGADATDASSSPLRPRRIVLDSPPPRRALASPPLPPAPPSRSRPPMELPSFCDDTSGAVGADLSGALQMDPLSVPAPPPPFDMSAVASSLPSMPGHPGLVRARADTTAGGPGGRMSPSVYNHKEVLSGDWAGRMSPSVYNHKLLAAAQGRSSPAYHHDLGYHTLVARSAAASPRQQPPSPWAELGYPSGMTPSARCPRDSPRPVLPEPPSSAELIMAFKGKRPHKSAPFDRLLDELILHIFSYLSTNELCYCARVCRRWYFLVWEPQLWTSITLTGETTGADRALRQIVKLLCRDNPGTLCHTVERVELNGCSRLTDRGLSLLARRCPELRRLELRGCHQVGDQAVMDIVSHCPNLQHLDLTGCHQVRCLDLSQAGADHRLNLQYLDLTDCHNLTDDSLKVIARHCPQLQHLYMRRCDQLTDAGIRHVPSLCPGLREFSISDCSRVTDFSLRELARLGPTLRYLSVAKCDRVSDAGVAQVARSCYKLRYLNVRGCEAVSDAALELVARCCQRLRALDIGKCDVTDHGLKVLAQHCPNLKKLSVKSCEMISDAGVKYVAYYCRGLQQLNIQDSPVTLEGYRTVKKYCKRCIIEHTNPGFF